MVQTSNPQAQVNSKVTVDFIASTMRLVNQLTPQMDLSDLESVSAFLEQALAIVEHTAGALEYKDSSEWTRVQSEELLPSSPSTLPSSSPPRSSPVPTLPVASSSACSLPLHPSTPKYLSSSLSDTDSVSSPVLPSGLTSLHVTEVRSIRKMLDSMTPAGKLFFYILNRD